ncbi:MAG: peptide ABC transporter substrate-binding protein [Cyanobacteriota bacterium]
MFKDSLPETEETSPASTPTPPKPEQESGQILVIGSKTAVTAIVHALCALRFCHISEWSPLLPAPIPGKLMRTLLRKVSTT